MLKKDGIYDVTIYLVDNEKIIGGYVGEWSVTKDSLENANEIIFHIVENSAGTEDEQFLFISGLNSYSKKIPGPELKQS